MKCIFLDFDGVINNWYHFDGVSIENAMILKKIIELSEELNIPFIITNDAHYLRPEDRPIHKAYLNAKEGDREVDSFYKTTYLMTDEEVKHFMNDQIGVDNIERAYENIRKIKVLYKTIRPCTYY